MTALHVLAGLLALAAGAVALAAAKGKKLHRDSGKLFAGAMLFMSASGAAMAAVKPDRISVVAGTLTFYLVATGLLALRRPRPGARRLEAAALLVALAVSAAGFRLGLFASASPRGTIDGLPAAPAFLFGVVALFAAIGDARLVRAGSLEGARRIARHLWRMCFALWIAAASFFLGQPQVFPAPLRRSGLLALPVLAVLLLLFYWLARVRLGTRYRQA